MLRTAFGRKSFAFKVFFQQQDFTLKACVTLFIIFLFLTKDPEDSRYGINYAC